MAEYVICPNPNCGFKGAGKLKSKGSYGFVVFLFCGGLLCGMVWWGARENLSVMPAVAVLDAMEGRGGPAADFYFMSKWGFIGMLFCVFAAPVYMLIRRGYRCYCPQCGMYCKDADGTAFPQHEIESQQERRVQAEREAEREAERAVARYEQRETAAQRKAGRQRDRAERMAKARAAVRAAFVAVDALPRRIAGEDRFMLIFYRVVMAVAVLVGVGIVFWLAYSAFT